MSQTVIRGTQILNNTVQRQDLDTSTVGQAVVTKLVQGGGITLSSTGADSGTGDVTVSSPDVVSTDAGNIATLGSDNHILVPQSQIWSVRLRTFQAILNSTFEVDQRNVNTAITLGAGSVSPWAQDRWQHTKVAATMVLSSQAAMPQNSIFVPGTNFRISQAYQIITLTTAQPTLAAGETCYFGQTVEGPQFRELTNDVHSISILCSTNVVGGLKFALGLRDPGSTRSLVKLCTITTPNVWQLITLPNLPIFASGGNFSSLPGSAGYVLSICYACGTTFTAPANDVWNNGNFVGAVGMDNLGAKPTGSNLIIAFIQDEPGAVCTTPIDCPFGQNYDGEFGCLRYFCKSYDYKTAIGSVTDNATFYFWQARAISQTFYLGLVSFPKRMAKVPSVAIYNPVTGAFNSISTSRGNIAVTSVTGLGESGFSDINVAAFTGPDYAYGHYIADTGW